MGDSFKYHETCKSRPVHKFVEQPRQPRIEDKTKLTEIGIELARIRATQAKLAETLEQVRAERQPDRNSFSLAASTVSDLQTKLTRLSKKTLRLEERTKLSLKEIDYVEMLSNGRFEIPPSAGLPRFNLTGVQHPSAQTNPHREATDQTSSETPTARSGGLACKIRLDLRGMLHKKPNFWQEPFAAMSTVNPICVFQEANASGVRCWLCCYEADSRRVVVTQGFSRITFQTFVTKDGQLNVQWMSDGFTYYINFADWSIRPGEILRNVLQTCGALWVPNPFDGNVGTGDGRHYLLKTPPAPEAPSRPSRTVLRRPTRMRADSPKLSPPFSFAPADPENQKPENTRKTEPEKQGIGRWALLPPYAERAFSFSPAVPTVAPGPTLSEDVEKDAEEDQRAKVERITEFKPVTAGFLFAETEAGEEVMFYEIAKLNHFDFETLEWKDCGLGVMKILRNQTTGRYEVLMRHDQICSNHQIVPGLKLLGRKSPKEYTLVASESTNGREREKYFAIRFTSEEQAKKFKEIFHEGLAAARRTAPAEPGAAKAEAPSPDSRPKPSASSSCSDKKIGAAIRTARVSPNPAEATQACGEALSDSANKTSPLKFVVEAAFEEMKSSALLSKQDPDPCNCSEALRPASSYTKPLAYASCYLNSDRSQVSKSPMATKFSTTAAGATPVVAPPLTTFTSDQTVKIARAPASTSPKGAFFERSTAEDRRPSIPQLSDGNVTFGDRFAIPILSDASELTSEEEAEKKHCV